jgi:hypothetical protein
LALIGDEPVGLGKEASSGRGRVRHEKREIPRDHLVYLNTYCRNQMI